MTDGTHAPRVDDDPGTSVPASSSDGDGDDLLYFDWRIRNASTIIAFGDEPAPPGVVAHQVTAFADGRAPAFITPSPSALALNVSIRASRDADRLRPTLQFTKVEQDDQGLVHVARESIPTLFDFFEHAYIAIVFAYQAIEAQANEDISRRLLDGKMRITLRRGVEELTAESVERFVSTRQKLTDVLPVLRSAKPPQKARWWAAYRQLESLRDATIHLKGEHAYPLATSLAPRSYFHEVIAMRSLLELPRAAIAALMHFEVPPEDAPHWLKSARELVAPVRTVPPAPSLSRRIVPRGNPA